MTIGRGFLPAAAAAAVLALAANPGAAQTKLKFQASFPATSIIYTCFEEFNKTVVGMTGGRVNIEALPAGAIVPAFEVLDATAKG
jgi:TRAP-type mannitol/chloroaromatic compound transport system substrate-binding protein